MSGIKDTLEKTYTIMKNYCSEHDWNAKPYNIFEVLEVSEKEVIMCRMLADLLNPKGLHRQGDKYLKCFLRDVLKEADADYICKTANIYREFPITEERRIDIVIMSADRFIPIEVKINAGEQKAQCYAYYQYAKRRDRNAKVIYLTKWGTVPSAYSLSSSDGKIQLDKDIVQPISFSNDIVKWLTNLIELEDAALMKEMLLQYKNAIDGFTQNEGENLQMEAAEMLVQSEKNFKSMLLIEKSANKAKALLMYKLMEEIESQMQPVVQKYGLKREERFHWYEYTEKADEKFYSQSESTYPGINYVVEQIKLPENVELWFRIEIDYALFAGICLFDPNAEIEEGVYGNQLDCPSEDIKKALASYINTEEAQYDAWWVQWWYLPTEETDDRINKDSIPNFKYMNEAAVRLSNDENRKNFVSEVVRVIERKLGRLFEVGDENYINQLKLFPHTNIMES